MSAKAQPKFCDDRHHFDLKSQTLEIFRAGSDPGWYDHHPQVTDAMGTWPETKTEYRTCKQCGTTVSFEVLGIKGYIPEVKSSAQRAAEEAELDRALAGLPRSRDIFRPSGEALEGSAGPGGGEENPFGGNAHRSWCSCHP